MSKAVNAFASPSLDTVAPAVGMFPATGSEPTVGTSLVTAAGLGLQVGISPANAETHRAHVKTSVTSIRFIVVTPV